MSTPSLSVLPPSTIAQAKALANPQPDVQRSLFTPCVKQGRFSSFHCSWSGSLVSFQEESGVPVGGFAASLVVGGDPQIIGSGAAVSLSYHRNIEILECKENSALDKYPLIDYGIIDMVLDSVQPKPGFKIVARAQSLADGSFQVTQTDIEAYPKRQTFSNHSQLPIMRLSSLRRTHKFLHALTIFLVRTFISPGSLSDDFSILKAARGDDIESLVKEIDFMSKNRNPDLLLAPTHVVLDDNDGLHGFLLPYQPASSVCVLFFSLHPDIEPISLAPAASNVTAGNALVADMTISWDLKLAWVVDIAAGVAWLHEQGIIWGDLKTDNVVLCTNGHCRLIDYCPGGQSTKWAPPESVWGLDWAATVTDDVFSLGLVLWSVALEVWDFERQQEDGCPLLLWNEHTPLSFQSLVSSCVQSKPGNRPSTGQVYDSLRREFDSL